MLQTALMLAVALCGGVIYGLVRGPLPHALRVMHIARRLLRVKTHSCQVLTYVGPPRSSCTCSLLLVPQPVLDSLFAILEELPDHLSGDEIGLQLRECAYLYRLWAQGRLQDRDAVNNQTKFPPRSSPWQLPQDLRQQLLGTPDISPAAVEGGDLQARASQDRCCAPQPPQEQANGPCDPVDRLKTTAPGQNLVQ